MIYTHTPPNHDAFPSRPRHFIPWRKETFVFNLNEFPSSRFHRWKRWKAVSWRPVDRPLELYSMFRTAFGTPWVASFSSCGWSWEPWMHPWLAFGTLDVTWGSPKELLGGAILSQKSLSPGRETNFSKQYENWLRHPPILTCRRHQGRRGVHQKSHFGWHIFGGLFWGRFGRLLGRPKGPKLKDV